MVKLKEKAREKAAFSAGRAQKKRDRGLRPDPAKG